MLIGIDGNEANVSEKVGVSVYTIQLLKYFQKKSNDSLRFIVFLKHRQNLDLPEQKDHYQYEIVPGNFLWSQTFLPLHLYKKKALGQKIDVFFSPAHYAPRFCPIPVVVTVHDLSYFYYPQEFLKKDLHQLKNWTKYSVEKARKVIAVSQTTKKDLVKFYNVPDEKIEVVYNGYEKSAIKGETNKTITYNLKPKTYILYVGTLQPRKNIDTLIQAFQTFKKSNSEFKLVLVGKKGWLYEHIFKLVEELKLEKDIIFTGYTSDTELINLYKNAFCFVLPSFYEGFGIPLLEAMSLSAPVISSYTSSLPEIGGEAALYFDPKNALELAEKLEELKENQRLRKELIKKGKERVKKFSWDKCGEQTLQVLTGQ